MPLALGFKILFKPEAPRSLWLTLLPIYSKTLLQGSSFVLVPYTLRGTPLEAKKGSTEDERLDGTIDSMNMNLSSSGSLWWTGKPGLPQSMGSQRVGHDWATELTDIKAIYRHCAYFIHMLSISYKMPGLIKHNWNQDCQEKYHHLQICRWYYSYL